MPVRWSVRTDRRGPMSVLDIDGDCPPDLGDELEDVLWSYAPPRRAAAAGAASGSCGIPSEDEERSEALALSQLLIVSHLVGAFDGAFEL